MPSSVRAMTKGKAIKGKSWGKGQKGSSWGKGKGGPYSFEDDGWNNYHPNQPQWAPMSLLKIVSDLDSEGFGFPKKIAAKRAIIHHDAQLEIRNRFSHLRASREEEPNEDIPILVMETTVEPYPLWEPVFRR